MNEYYKRTYWPTAKSKHKSPEIFTVTTDSKFLSKILHFWFYYIKGYGWVKD